MSAVQLGFCEKVVCEAELQPEYFPSKIGGKPAWVDPQMLPRGEDCVCPQCEGQMTLLMQVYAPLDEKVVGHGNAFHRMIFVFSCKTGFCHQSSSPFVVWRVQLPKDNPLIEDIPEPDEEDDDDLSLEEDQDDYQIDPPSYSSPDLDLHHSLSWLSHQVCQVCGVKATKRCDRCKHVWYCSRAHQLLDWSSGHKTECPFLASSPDTAIEGRNEATAKITKRRVNMPPQEYERRKARGKTSATNKSLFPHLTISTEPEDADLTAKIHKLLLRWEKAETQLFSVHQSDDEALLVEDEDDLEDEVREMEEQSQQIIKKLNSQVRKFHRTAQDAEDVLEESVNSVLDRYYLLFQTVVQKNPDQVMRYQFGGLPLWVRKNQRPGFPDPDLLHNFDSVPPCPLCGSDRVFEFQILPQMLFYLDVDKKAKEESTIDWGSLFVYSCSKSCQPSSSSSSGSSGCAQEFLWRQKEVAISTRFQEID